MGSLYLNRLNYEERKELKKKLLEIQKDKCFICEEAIDLDLHPVEIDHIHPISVEGKDDPTNFALVHSNCNESKQDSNLRVARILARFKKIQNECLKENRSANLADILNQYNGSKFDLHFIYEEKERVVKYSFSEIGDNKIYTERVYIDKLSGFMYFFAELPIEYLFHDDKINPRPIGMNVSKLVKEFSIKRPQLHISLGWINTNSSDLKIKIFDGQHKAVAQILLGVKNLPVRVFLNPDLEILLATNTNAGTTLRQVAFDKSVQRHLGNAIYIDKVKKYQQERNLSSDDYNFSERDLVNYFKGESREMKRYILDSVRDGITYHQDNKLKDFIDFGGRGRDKPLSYSTMEKTFYSFFIYQDTLNTPINLKLEEGENPRQIEREQIVNLMNIITEELFISKFNPDIASNMIESKIRKGELIPEDHLIACRISKEEIIYNWLKYIEQIIILHFGGKTIQNNKLFHKRFPEPLWDKIKTFIKNLRELPLWINKELSSTVFGGKQNNEYWQIIFETGKTPQGFQVLAKPIDLIEMF